MVEDVVPMKIPEMFTALTQEKVKRAFHCFIVNKLIWRDFTNICLSENKFDTFDQKSHSQELKVSLYHGGET